MGGYGAVHETGLNGNPVTRSAVRVTPAMLARGCPVPRNSRDLTEVPKGLAPEVRRPTQVLSYHVPTPPDPSPPAPLAL